MGNSMDDYQMDIDVTTLTERMARTSVLVQEVAAEIAHGTLSLQLPLFPFCQIACPGALGML